MNATCRHALCASMMTAATLFPSPVWGTPSESTEVLRVQVEVTVCDTRNAGTTDPVSARVTESEAGGEITWLERPGPNFERGQRYRYDLLLGGVRTLADISELVIEKRGGDDLCVRELQLLVNAQPIFLRTYGGGAWLNGSTQNVLRATGAELRANASWQSYGWSLPEWIATTGAAVSRDEVSDRLTSTVATAMHDLGLSWKAPPDGLLLVQREDDNAVHARVVLERDGMAFFSSAVGLEFDLRVCPNGRSEPVVTNVAAHQLVPWYAAVFSASRAQRDEQTLNVLRSRLLGARPIVLAGGICARVDGGANISY